MRCILASGMLYRMGEEREEVAKVVRGGGRVCMRLTAVQDSCRMSLSVGPLCLCSPPALPFGTPADLASEP